MSSGPISFQRPRIDWVALLGILALAALLRFWNLDGMPPGFYHDEAYNGLDAISLTEGRLFPIFYEGWELYADEAHGDRPPTPTRFPLFFEGNYGREPLHIYLMALSVELFGATPRAIRAVPAAAGVLAVLTTFISADTLFTRTSPHLRRTVPLLAAFSLAILFPAIHFSRFGLRAMLFVPIATLAVTCFWQALLRVYPNGDGSHRSRWGSPALWFALTGVLVGFGLYIYAAARLFPLVFAGYCVLWLWRDRVVFRRHLAGVLLMGAAAVAVALPLLLYFARYPYFFVFRTAFVANKGVGAVEGRPLLTWLGNVGRVVGGFFWQGETHLRHNLPGRPYLDALQATLFVAGLIDTVRNRAVREGPFFRAAFLALWLGVMLLATVMSGDAPHFGRMTGAAPVVAILIGVGGAWLLGVLTPHVGRWATAVVVALFAVSAVWTSVDYFGRYANHPQIAADFYLPDWALGQQAATYPETTSLFLSPNQAEMATIYFALGGDAERLHSYDGFHRLVPRGSGNTVYFVRPDDAATLANLLAAFPDATVDKGGDEYVTVSVSAETPQLVPSATVLHRFDDAITLVGVDTQAVDDTLDVTLHWQAARDLDRDFTAFVHLLDADGAIVAQRDRPPLGYPTSDWRGGELIVDTLTVDAVPGAVALRTGFYDSADLTPLGEPLIAPLPAP